MNACMTPYRARFSSANIPNVPLIASRAYALVLLAFALMAMALAPAHAQPSTGRNGAVFVGGESHTLFEARGVPVDVTAATITEARERALTQGRINGLRQVMEHL